MGTFEGAIGVVIPAYREGQGIAATVSRINEILANHFANYEIVLVDDGSPDDTFARIQEIAATNRHVRGIRLSRNFGKEAALLAGLRTVRGDAVITIDADLQHPPELIPHMIQRWREGAKVVNAVKRDRNDAKPFYRWRASLFNRAFSGLTGINLVGASDYKLLDRQAVNILIDSFPEKMRFYRGLTAWIGLQQASVPFDVASRRAGSSSWSTRALLRLAMTALLTHTSAPLRLVTLVGSGAMLVGLVVAIDALWSWIQGQTVSGFTTLIMTMLITGSAIMISLGVIGEYLAKIYDEVKARPAYLVGSTCGDALESSSLAVRDLAATTATVRAIRLGLEAGLERSSGLEREAG
jgi:glycosyltransferase involved in cell wall biosynthesis